MPPRLVVPGPDDPFPPSVVDDDRVTHAVVDEAARAVQSDALREHATQVIVASEDVHALSNLVAVRTTAREGFRRVDPLTWETVGGPVRPRRGGPARLTDASGRHTPSWRRPGDGARGAAGVAPATISSRGRHLAVLR